MKPHLPTCAFASAGLAFFVVARPAIGDEVSPAATPSVVVTPDLASHRARWRLIGLHTVVCPPVEEWFHCYGEDNVWIEKEEAVLIGSRNPTGEASCTVVRRRESFTLSWTPEGCTYSDYTPQDQVTIQIVDADGQPTEGSLVTDFLTYRFSSEHAYPYWITRDRDNIVYAHQVDDHHRVIRRSAPELIGDRDHVVLRLTEDVEPVHQPIWKPGTGHYFTEAITRLDAAIRDPDLGLEERATLAYEAGEAALAGWVRW